MMKNMMSHGMMMQDMMQMMTEMMKMQKRMIRGMSPDEKKEMMKDSSVKYHLEKAADGIFVLHVVNRAKDAAGNDTWAIGPGQQVGR